MGGRVRSCWRGTHSLLPLLLALRREYESLVVALLHAEAVFLLSGFDETARGGGAGEAERERPLLRGVGRG